MEKTVIALEEHKLSCTQTMGMCETEKAFHTTIYYLNQELEDFGIVQDENSFTTEEKKAFESKIDEQIKMLDKLLAENQILKNGHEILFNELQELKGLMYLGKKNIAQLTIGKFSDMVAGHVIGNSIGQSLLEVVKPVYTNLIS